MQAGVCVGVTGASDCSGSGWSPNWLPPLAFADTVDALVAQTGGIVCPYCVLDRADVARIPGFNKPKYQRIKAALDGLNCFTDRTARPRHTHLLDFNAETVWSARSSEPQPGERGY